jgi:uncharacterized protein (DUF2336 family)
VADIDTGREQQKLNADEALKMLERRLQASQDELASRTDAGEDVLKYLAQHGAVATRTAVAANPMAPPESNLLLADDVAEEVRVTLAHKIGKLFPGMLLAEEEHWRDLAIKTLEKLAANEAVRVRAVLAEEIKNLDCVPKTIIKQMAEDAAADVASPIIECSPLLNDDDLIEIVATVETNSILESVARRKGLTDRVSDAVVATRNTTAIAALLRNVDASIRKRTLDRIVSQAAEIAEWHGPLVLRAELSPESVRRLAAFVGTALIKALAARNNLDDTTIAYLEKKLTERRTQDNAADAVAEPEAAEEADQAAHDVDMAYQSGNLDDGFVARAIEDHRKETIVCALSKLAKVSEKSVRTILETKSARAVTALIWKAGLTMRTAYKIQTTVMHLSSDKLLPARGGVDFPLTEDEMRKQLSFINLENA